MITMTPCRIFVMIAIFMVAESVWSVVDAMPVKDASSEEEGIVTGSEFLSVLLGSDPNDHLVHDINKKEAPRIRETLDDVLFSPPEVSRTVSRTSRSSNEEQKDNSLKTDLISNAELSDNEDLQSASSSFYSETANDRLKNSLVTLGTPANYEEDIPKIIGIRVTSSVAIGRGNNTSQVVEQPPPISSNIQETFKRNKINELLIKSNENPTTWRPSIFQFINRDVYKGASSNRHSVSTLPGTQMGANEDYIQQQKERELNKKKSDLVHPYQRSISYRGHPREGQRPRSFSYSSIINTFGEPKLTTSNEWPSTKTESVATEATAGYVTIINHNNDNSVDELKNNDRSKPLNAPIPNVPPLPIVYSEPAKIYSEPAKIYGEPAKVYGKQEQIYSEPAKVYSEPAKNYGEPAKIYGEPAKVYSEPAKIYSEPAKIYSQPSSVYHPQPNSQTKDSNNTQNRVFSPAEQNYEVEESVSVMTNGRTHGVQEKPVDDSQKVGYVVEGRNFRKYRVEERTSDGFIVGEYGVVSHDDGSLRGVRYTADGTTNPRLIYDALMKFLSL